MELKSFFAADLAGNLIKNCLVHVYQPASLEHVPAIYDKFNEELTNPFESKSSGEIEFRAPDGEYDVRIITEDKSFTRRVSFNSVNAIASGKANASAIGIAGTANDMGTGWSGVIPNNATAKEAFVALEQAVIEGGTFSVQPEEFYATEGQTVFEVPYVMRTRPFVYRNGDRQSKANYSYSGDQVILGDPCVAGEFIEIVFGEKISNSVVLPEHVSGTFNTIPSFPAIIDLRVLGSRRADVRDWEGMDTSGNNDCTFLIQDAFEQSALANVPLESPGGNIALTANIDVPDGAVFRGPGSFYMASENEGRLMFNLEHSGKGFTVLGATGGATFSGFGTRRNQPAPSIGWEPAGFDWDFYIDGAGDVKFHDLLLLNPTKGIICTNGGGRFSFSEIWGQPLQTGIQIDTSYDRSLIDNVHFWNFWSEGLANEGYVWDYITRNATAIYSKRNDNGIMSRLFSIFYRHLLRIGHWSGGQPGTTQKLRVYGIDADVGGSGLTIDADVNGANAQIFGYYSLGNPNTITEASSIDIRGTNSDIGIYGKVGITDAHRHAINVIGAGTAFTIGDLKIAGYNLADNGYAAVNAEAGIFGIDIQGRVGISGGINGAPHYSGTGRIIGVWRDYTPTITSETPSLTTTTVDYSRFRVDGSRCRVVGRITIVTNGTGAGDVRITLPIPCAATGVQVGVAKTSSAEAATIQPFAGTSIAAINLYDGTYPGGDGVTLDYNLEYEI